MHNADPSKTERLFGHFKNFVILLQCQIKNPSELCKQKQRIEILKNLANLRREWRIANRIRVRGTERERGGTVLLYVVYIVYKAEFN